MRTKPALVLTVLLLVAAGCGAPGVAARGSVEDFEPGGSLEMVGDLLSETDEGADRFRISDLDEASWFLTVDGDCEEVSAEEFVAAARDAEEQVSVRGDFDVGASAPLSLRPLGSFVIDDGCRG